MSFLETLNEEQLQQYYIDLPVPADAYKGPTTGDSLYMELLPLAAPETTTNIEPLWIHRRVQVENKAETDTTTEFEIERKVPSIAIGAGKLAFHGDLYEKKFRSPTTGRLAYDLSISQRVTRYLQLDFVFLMGKLGANEWMHNRNENFVSEIRSGGLNLLYNFGNFIPDQYRVRPFISLGITGFEFLSKTDLKDQTGKYYHYWSDGSIKDRAEGSPGAQFAGELQRDYNYESDIRELNRDGFGKYRERAWSMPVGVGAVLKINEQATFKIGFQYHFTTTDHIDGIAAGGLNERAGNNRNDNFSYTFIGIQYDLAYKKRKRAPRNTFERNFWPVEDKEDRDGDGVTDFKDDCHGTPAGAKVDERGCPLDDDGDGVPNYRDEELASAPGAIVDGRGITLSDDHWKNWYARYMNDSTSTEVLTEIVGNIYANSPKKEKKKAGGEIYTVELVRYNGAIPSDELAFLMSIGDITSTTLEDGTTVVYTSGNYQKIGTAVKRRDEFRTSGNRGAGVSKVREKDIVKLSEEELDHLLKGELEELMNVSLTDLADDFNAGDIVYRVQLGAFKNKISPSVFNTSAGVLELKTGESVYRYVTRGYRTIEEAAAVRADLVIQGYSDAFVTAYKGGKRIPMNQTTATVEKGYKEDLSEDKIFNSIDRKLLTFKVQLGPLKKKAFESTMDEKVSELKRLEKQITPSGSIRYTSGEFSSVNEAEKHKKQLENSGFMDAFVIAMFKNEVISMQEAMELLK